MIPRNINRQRFEYLLGHGLKPGELKTFFKERRQALIMFGAKVQNPPTDPAAAIALVDRFSADAHRVLGAWIQELPDEECDVDRDQWIPRYKATEQFGVHFPHEEVRAVARAGLKELYSENPRADWIAFLATPPFKDVGALQELNHSIEIALPSESEWVAFGRWLCGAGPVEEIASPFLRDAAAIVAAWDRRAPALAVNTEESRRAMPVIEKAIEEAERHAEPASVRRGLRTLAPMTRDLEEGVDYLALPVIATRVYSTRSGPYMAAVEAFVDETGPFRLDDSDVKAVVKTLGRIAIFPDRGFAAPPPGEAVMYRVEPHVTTLPVQVRAKEVVEGGLISVVRVPYATKEAHEIRKAIEQYARAAHARPAVFVSADELCLKPRVDSLMRVLAPDFDWMLDTWESLDGIELSKGTYVLAPLPPPTGKLSCGPLAAAAVRLIRDALRRSKVGMTRAQIAQFQELLRDDALGVDDLSRKRLEENIQSISAASEEYDELVALLMESPKVRADVEQQVQATVTELVAERQKEIGSIEGLKSQREAMETKIEELRSEVDKKARAVREAVTRAFDKASRKEIEALGETSVLLALIGRDLHVGARTEAVAVSAVTGAAANTGPASPSAFIRVVPRLQCEIRDVFRNYGLSSDTSERLSRALRAAVALSLPIVTRGSGARALGENLAPALSTSDCEICEISIGLTLNERLETRLRGGAGGAILFLDANLSDISIYAPGVLDEVVMGALGKKGGLSARPLVFALSSGPAGLPLPTEIDELAVDLDLNALAESFDSGERAVLRPQGALVKRALKRLDTDVELANLDIAPAVMDDLMWLLCQASSPAPSVGDQRV